MEDEMKEKRLLQDPKLEEEEEEVNGKRRASVWHLLFGAFSIISFLCYTRTPYYITTCLHHIKQHTLTQAESLGALLGPQILVQKRTLQADNSSAVCNTATCKEYAKQIIDSLAPNHEQIDPCTDFDQFACKGWLDKHDWRPDQASVSAGSVMGDTIKSLLHSILEGKYTNNRTSMVADERNFDMENFNLMKDVYQTCMNEDAIKAYGVKPVTDILDDFEKVFPRVGKALYGTDSNDELTKAVIWLGEHSVSGLVSADSTADDKNPDTVVISIGSTELAFAKQYYKKPGVMANWTTMLGQTRQILKTGKPIWEAPITEAVKPGWDDYANRVREFEIRVAQNTPDPEQAQDVEYYYKPRTVADVDKMIPEISLSSVLKAYAPKEYPITPNLTIIVGDINYYGNLSTIIKSTPRESLHDYFVSRLIATWSGRLHRNYTSPSRAISNQLAGKDPNTVADRWRTCISEVDGNLGYILSAAFVERAFSAADKMLGDRIISDIKEFFNKRFQQFDWMTPRVKELAAKKVVNIIQKVGYQTKNPNVADPATIYDYYSKLNLPPNSTYFQNGKAYAEFSRNRSWNDLLHPYDRNRWGMTSPTVNAYYSPSGNEIVFPAGIMQIPVFNAELPEYVNYGSFGAVAGHELTHGFDNHGSHYDERGVLRDWWDNETLRNFDKKSQCFVKQYEKFTVPGLDGEELHVNGKLTLGENIADAGGLTASYSAWKQREAASPNPLLPGLEKFTKDQMFFIAYSNWWCGKVRPAQKVSYIYTDAHSPADKRIVGTTANSAAFKQAFNCKVKEPNCELW